jgi:hypothetical protein
MFVSMYVYLRLCLCLRVWFCACTFSFCFISRTAKMWRLITIINNSFQSINQYTFALCFTVTPFIHLQGHRWLAWYLDCRTACHSCWTRASRRTKVCTRCFGDGLTWFFFARFILLLIFGVTPSFCRGHSPWQYVQSFGNKLAPLDICLPAHWLRKILAVSLQAHLHPTEI